MKRIYFSIMMLAIMVAALSFTACGGDDDDEINGNVSIVGVWECESAQYGEWDDMLEANTKVGDLFIVNSDYTYKIVGHGGDSGTWSQNGKSFTMKPNGTYSVPVTYQISELTPTTLTLSLTSDIFAVKVSFRKAQE